MDLVDCPVDISQRVSKYGVYANAFRVVPETGEECFLDFCVFSAQEQRAEVVARLRIHRAFLSVIREQLRGAMAELDPAQLHHVRLVLCRATDE